MGTHRDDGSIRFSMKTTIAWCAALGALATATTANARLAFEETFDDGALSGWVPSADEKYNGRAVAQMAKDSEDYGLYLPKEAQHYGLSKPLEEV